MILNNKIMLITYADCIGENLIELSDIIDTYYKYAIGGIHILPFFPSSADRGFAPMCYDRVDEDFGSFDDIIRLGKDYYLMFDFMINHISRSSNYFIDFKQRKDESKYKSFFIRYNEFWDNGEPTEEQVDLIYKRKPRAPYIDVEFDDKTTEKIWCTFSEEQVDLNVSKEETKKYIREILIDMCHRGVSIIRLDAFAYAIKKQNTSCFFIEPDTWNLLNEINETVKPYNVAVLPEIHEHYSIQMKIAKHGFWIYDFALPVLVLNALYESNGKYLKKWLDMSPKKQFTTLDTHDGIGIIDVKDLLPDEEILKTKENMFSKGANVKKIYNSAEYNNLDIYQVNTTYYSALGNSDKSYLLARAIQFFAPGIPHVYYVGMFVGENDIELMEKTKNGRDINRHFYTKQEIQENFNRQVVQKMKKLMELRNSHSAFAVEGDIEVLLKNEYTIIITRHYKEAVIKLNADLKTHEFTIDDVSGDVIFSN